MNVIRAAALLILALLGAVIWIIAAHVDRVVNGGELLGVALIAIAAYQFWKAYRTA